MSPGGLHELVESVRSHVERRVRVALGLWLGAGVLVVLLVAALVAGPDGWGSGTAGPLVLDAVLLAAAVSAAVLHRRLRRRWMAEDRVTDAMDEAAGLAAGTTLGSLEVARSLPIGVSESLAAHGERAALRELSLPRERLAGRLGRQAGSWSGRAQTLLRVLVPAVLLLAALAPARSFTAWRGLGSPFRLLAEPALPPLRVEPGDVEVLRGGDLDIRVEAPGRSSVTLHWQAVGDVARSETVAPTAGVADFTLRAVRAPLDYRVEASGGGVSRTFHVTPVDPLFVGELTVELAFPPHTGRVPEEYRGEVPALSVPAGTRIRVHGEASRPLARAALLREVDRASESGSDAEGAGNPGEAALEPEVALTVEENAFSGSWLPRRSGLYRWSFADETGASAEVVPGPLELTVVPDSAPSVDVTFPGRDTVLPITLRQPLVVRARDDYGLGLLELVTQRVTSLGERRDPEVRAMEPGGSRGVLARPVLDVSEWGLLPGDTVRYFARVVDNGPTPQASRSREYVLRMPGVPELRRAAQQRLEDVSRRMEELSEQAAEAADDTRDLERRSAASRSDRERGRRGSGARPEPREERAGFAEREELRRALEEQRAMAERMDSMQAELREMDDAMREAGARDPELAEDLSELRELMERIATPEMRERLDRMARELDRMDAREAGGTLEELGREQEEFRRRLEESLERFRRAAADQDFRATAAEAEELAREEAALADAMREDADPGPRAEQQTGLEERAAETEERMAGLERQLHELGETQSAREVRRARESSAEARREMVEAARQARQGEGEQAGERADRASEGMAGAARRLQEARQDMAEQQADQVRNAMRETADDALALARRQAEIGRRIDEAGADELAGLRGDQAALMQGMRNVAEKLSEGTREAGGGGREMSESMGRAMMALEETARSLDTGPGRTSSPAAAAEQAVDALNQVALLAMAGARQGGSPSQGQASGQPGVQEQLEELAQRQGQVNNRAGRVMPMQLGEQALRKQLQELSQGQESVAEELDDVAGRPESEGESMGDLEALASEARELARELAGGRLDARTRERQERLFHRLLDAGRSLENEELSDERESRIPAAFERAEVAPLDPDALGRARFRLPDADVLRALPPARRQLVLDYFERLNRASAAEGGSGGAAGGSGDGSGGGP